MHELRRSARVTFPGWRGNLLAGILDQPIEDPKGFLLFAHCFTCNKDLKAIVRISRRLAEHGWGVLRFDFSGLGDSQGDFSKSSFTSNRFDLLAAADYLRRVASSPIALIGHSFGGAACLSCSQEIDSVRGIVCIASPSDTHHLATLLERMNPAIRQQGTGSVTIGGRNYDITSEMLDDFRSHDLPRSIAQCRQPVLVFHSLVDETLGYEHAMRIFALVNQRRDDQPGSPGATLITLTTADHLLTRSQADIVYVTDIIHVWLRRVTVASNVAESQ